MTGLWAGWCRNAELELLGLYQSLTLKTATDPEAVRRRISVLEDEIAAVRAGWKSPSIVLRLDARGRTSPRYSPPT